jgi:hypothetical protein
LRKRGSQASGTRTLLQNTTAHGRSQLLVPDPQEDREWSALIASQFLDGYADENAIYDRLPTL